MKAAIKKALLEVLGDSDVVEALIAARERADEEASEDDEGGLAGVAYRLVEPGETLTIGISIARSGKEQGHGAAD